MIDIVFPANFGTAFSERAARGGISAWMQSNFGAIDINGC
jgi:hypothetical protein